jgi:transmembrane 9 superfamily member 2/4
VKYHRDEQRDVSRIVAFEVKPYRCVKLCFQVFECRHHSSCYIQTEKIDMCCSVKHEYDGQWNDKKTRLTTCDPHAQRVITSSDSPQEVEVGRDIIFTYDVDFKVRYI